VGDPEERFWRRRLEWRLRGGLQWPAFVLFTLLDAVVLWQLPPLATRDLNPFDGVFMAIFGNLILLGVAAPFLAKRLIRRQQQVAPAGPTVPPPQVEREVLQDRVAAALLAVGLGACVVSGLANRPVIVSETKETEEVGRQLRTYVQHSGSAELRRNLEAANTLRLGEGYFRACLPRDDRRRYVCILVDTNKDPVKVRRDPSNSPNSEIVAPASGQR
jgi:hypothetical protein